MSDFGEIGRLSAMKRVVPPLTIKQPCPMDWNSMPGDDKRRFCDQCGCHVHNLSALTATEQIQFAEKNGGKECISYVRYEDDTIASRSWGDRIAALFKPLRWALASILPFGLISCETRRTLGKPCPANSPIEKSDLKVGRGVRVAGSPQVSPNKGTVPPQNTPPPKSNP